MQSRLLHEADGQRTFVVVLGTGDEVLSSLQDFVEREHIHAAALTAIGALSDATLLYFNWETKTHDKIPVHEQVEVASLIGDVAESPQGKPALHRPWHSRWQRHGRAPRRSPCAADARSDRHEEPGASAQSQGYRDRSGSHHRPRNAGNASARFAGAARSRIADCSFLNGLRSRAGRRATVLHAICHIPGESCGSQGTV
jgi:hypothetical protein